MMNKASILAASLVCLWVGSAATAAEMKGSGTLVFVPVSQEATKLASGSTLVNSTIKGVMRDNDASSPLSLVAQDCTATVLVSADGQSQTGGGHCTATDKDGDAWWLSFMLTASGSNWTVMGGSGKYEGMTGGGTTTVDAHFPDGRLAEHYEGTVTLK